MKFKALPSFMILFILIVTSCNTPTPSSPNGSNPNVSIEVQVTGSESRDIGTETISQQNCTGNAEVENTVEKSRTIEYVIELQNGASVNANGQVGFAGTDIELGATVATQLGHAYGTSETISRSITVKAKSGTHIQHVIRQMEVWKVGQAKISVGAQQTIIPFKFPSDFAIELAESNQVICDNNGTTNNTDPQPTAPQPTVEIVIPDTPTPENISYDTAPDSILSVGEVWTTNGLSVQLRDAQFKFGDEMDLYFEFTNNTGKTLFFNFNEANHVTLKDDKGKVYTWNYTYQQDVVLENGRTYSEQVFKGGNFSGIQYLIIELNIPDVIKATWRYN
ncbi:MAG: hypothetical protein IPP66_15265 [Anaerolineales bacterium]|nr:hypothetical protein [Anaerolineales bacterium]